MRPLRSWLQATYRAAERARRGRRARTPPAFAAVQEPLAECRPENRPCRPASSSGASTWSQPPAASPSSARVTTPQQNKSQHLGVQVWAESGNGRVILGAGGEWPAVRGGGAVGDGLQLLGGDQGGRGRRLLQLPRAPPIPRQPGLGRAHHAIRIHSMQRSAMGRPAATPRASSMNLIRWPPTRTHAGVHGTGESSRMGLWLLTHLPQTGVNICRMLALSCCECLVLHTEAVSGVRHQIVASWIAFVGDS